LRFFLRSPVSTGMAADWLAVQRGAAIIRAPVR
jgi:hypothetical protein